MFEASTGDVDLQQRDINGKGERFINSGVQNFGIKGRTDRQAKIFHANTITIDFFGNAYYRPFKYKMATHNHVFSLSGEIIKNEAVGLYLVSQMSYLNKMFSFNNMGTWTEIKKLSLCLLVTSDGSIDFSFMEGRMRELEEERMRELEAYLNAAGFEDCTLTAKEKLALNRMDKGLVNMKEIAIGTLIEIVKGKRLTKAEMIPGDMNFIGATSQNNGITAKIANDRYIHPKNTITVTYNGSVGEAFYQTEPYWASDDVNVLYSNALNEDKALFFLALLAKKGKKYAYSFKWTKEKMANDKIYLPVDRYNNVDYALMETYIRAVKKECIARLKAEINRERKVYREVISPKI